MFSLDKNDITNSHAISVRFNSYLRRTKWADIAEYVEEYYLDFLKGKDYGELIITNIYFYLEETPDFALQKDDINLSTIFGIPKMARLNIHFDFKTFTTLSKLKQKNVAINTLLYLLKYWHENLKIPKNMRLKELVQDFEIHLKNDNTLMKKKDLSEIIIKITNPFNVTFSSHKIIGIDQKGNPPTLFDSNELDKFFNNRIYNMDFGQSVREVFISYDIFDFENKEVFEEYFNKDIEFKYGRNKDLFIAHQFDINRFIYDDDYLDQTRLGQIKELHAGILKAILKINSMDRKPKFLDVEKLHNTFDKIFLEFESKL